MMMQTTLERPDPIDLLPRRGRRAVGRHHEPRYIESLVDHSAIAGDRGSFIGVRSVPPQPLVTFGRKRGTFIYVSGKTGTTQEGEGPWEMALAKECEVNPLIVEYQMHGSELEFGTTDAGRTRSYRPDATYWSFETGLTIAEVKACAPWFGQPEVRATCDDAREALARYGIAFAEISGDDLRRDARRAYNVARAFADRTTAITEAQRGDVRDLLSAGDAPFGRVAEVLRVHPSRTLQCLNGLMVKREVAYDLSTVVCDDMPVTVPPPPPADMPDIRRIGH